MHDLKPVTPLTQSLSEEELEQLITTIAYNFLNIYQAELVNDSSAPQILRPKEVQKILGCSRSQVDILSQTDPDFPKVIRLSSRWTGYLKSEIYKYIEHKGKTAR